MTLDSIKSHLKNNSRSLQTDTSPDRNIEQTDEKNLTTYGRFNRISNNLKRFDLTPFDKVFNPDRMQAVTVRDALTDPHLTIENYADPFKKDPGYRELRKRDSFTHDIKSKIFKDYKNNLIVKLDHRHGERNGGLYY